MATNPPSGRPKPNTATPAESASDDCLDATMEFSLQLIEHYDTLEKWLIPRIPLDMRATVSAQDVVQEAVASAFRHRVTFADDGDPEAFQRWLFTIAHNKLRNMIRSHRAVKRGRGRAPVADGGGFDQGSAPYGEIRDLLGQLTAADRTPSRIVSRRESVQAVQIALRALPDDYRQVVQLRYIEGLDVAETGRQMGRSPGSVQMLCHRALRRLAQNLGRASHFLSTRA